MRFISVVAVLACCCFFYTEVLFAQDKPSSEKPSPQLISEDGPTKAETPAEQPPGASPSLLGSGRKKSETSINLKVGIDYDSQKGYSVAKRERASEYFTRGKLLYEAGDFASAAEAFKLAYETLPHQAVLGNIALCYDRAGKWPNAVVYYRKYFLDPVDHKENRQMRERLDELNGLVGEMIVKCRLKGCNIRVDGMNQGRSPVETVLLPGEHRVEAMVKGEIVDDTVAEIGARDVVTVEIAEPAVTPEPAEPAPKPPVTVEMPVVTDSRFELKHGFWIAAGVAVGAGVGIVVCGTLTLKYNKDFEKENAPLSIRTTGENYKLATNVLVGVASAAAVVALALGVTALRKKKKAKQPKLSFSIGEGLAVRGTF
jgi:hypothetical protein